MTDLILITGGVKSGKSRLASACLESVTDTPRMIATARRTDDEMSRRIDRHIADRGPHWTAQEVPLELATALSANPGPVLVDCLGVWLTNILIEQPQHLAAYITDLKDSLARRQSLTVLVSNESSLGIIGADALTRQYIDELGLLNQAIAQMASHVAMSVVGLPQWLKGQPFIQHC